MLYEWWNGDIIRDGTVEAELIQELDRRDGDLVVEKHTYSAFRGIFFPLILFLLNHFVGLFRFHFLWISSSLLLNFLTFFGRIAAPCFNCV